jgi:dTDP-4-amino-4,6-dideoxygalactose transaminase
MQTNSSTEAGQGAPAPEPIALVDLRRQFQSLREELVAVLQEVGESTEYVLGSRVAAFETAFAEYAGVRHCVGVNSGTSALHLALLGAGVGPGDEVITVPMTFVATCWAVSYVGARPVFVDVDPRTYTMDPEQVAARITSRTRAILPVHLYGQPVDLDPLLQISERFGIPLIEDAAQAHGARYHGRPVGGFGQSGCFSFYPGKNLGAMGEGGAVVTNDSRLAARFRALRNHAQAERYHHDEIGFNYRMDGLQGAVLGVKLRYLEAWTEARRAFAARYQQALADLPVVLPFEAPNRRHVWHLYVVQHPERDRLHAELNQQGILASLHYPVPVHLQKAYADLGHRPGEFPVSERLAAQCLSLPLHPELTVAEQDRVVEALRKSLGEGA